MTTKRLRDSIKTKLPKKMEIKKTDKWTWFFTILIISLAAVAYFHIEQISDLPTSFRPIYDKDGNRLRENLEREIDDILKQTNTKNRDAYETAIADLRVINTAFDRAEEGIEPSVDALASFKGCAILCYHIAKDKFSGTYKTEERIKSVMDAHIGQNVLYASQQMENVLARLNDALGRNTTDMQVSLASTSETVLGSEDETTRKAFKDYVAQMSTVSEDLSNIALGTTISGFGLTISAILVKTTLRQAINVLGHIAQRIKTSTSYAIYMAAADGDFPIGDAIAVVLEVGAATWCAYDLFKAQTLLKEQVTVKLTNALVQYRGEVLAQGKKSSDSLLKAYHEKNLKIVKNLTNHLF